MRDTLDGVDLLRDKRGDTTATAVAPDQTDEVNAHPGRQLRESTVAPAIRRAISDQEVSVRSSTYVTCETAYPMAPSSR